MPQKTSKAFETFFALPASHENSWLHHTARYGMFAWETKHETSKIIRRAHLFFRALLDVCRDNTSAGTVLKRSASGDRRPTLDVYRLSEGAEIPKQALVKTPLKRKLDFANIGPPVLTATQKAILKFPARLSHQAAFEYSPLMTLFYSYKSSVCKNVMETR